MSTTANRTRGAVPTRMAAAIAALSLLAMPVPAGAQGSGRTVLLTLTEGASLSQLADTVGALGGRVLATLELSDSLLVELPKGVGAPAGSAEIPDTPMKVNGTPDSRCVSRAAPTARRSAPRTDPALAKASLWRWWTRASPTFGRPASMLCTCPSTASETGDGLGHGTFLAGLIGWQRDSFQGVAPAATLLDVKVADKSGSTSLCKVLQGLEIAIATRRTSST